jgi:hypothetical protein
LLEKGLGDWDAKARTYGESLRFLRAIRIEAGNRDEFPWIPRGARRLASLLESIGANAEFASFPGTHESHIAERLAVSLFPFFSRNLAFESP